MSLTDTLEEIIEILKYGLDNHDWASVEEAHEYLREEKERLVEESDE